VERFRVARFESSAISSIGGNKHLARGTLSLHGLTRQIALPFTLDNHGDTAGRPVTYAFFEQTSDWVLASGLRQRRSRMR